MCGNCDKENQVPLEIESPELYDIDELQKLISDWSNETFGEGVERSTAILHHLKKEVPELIEAVEKYQSINSIKDISESNLKLSEMLFEFADCLMLLLDSADKMGISGNLLIYYCYKKLAINKLRKWGEPDENGVCEHISV